MLKVGTKVLVNVPVEHETKQLIKFNGMESVITAKTKTARDSGIAPMYAVKYCESYYGVPYWFIEDWLIEL